ncbi:MAG: hypothetical protein RJB13_1853 [Pseudomonadota bacterium]
MRKLNRDAVACCFWLLLSAQTVSCGRQTSPAPQLETKIPAVDERGSGSVSEGEETFRSSSELDKSLQEAPEPRQRLEIFQAKIEPLALQRGGSARIVLPLTDDPTVAAQIQSIAFSSASSALRGTSVQGRVLAVVVDGDAAEGRHDARILVQLGNGSIFSQPVAISVLP